MKKRFMVLVLIIAISLIISVSAFLIAKNTSNSPPTGPITCNILQENPGGINIVFFSTEEQAKEYMDYLLSVIPFDKNKEKFSFYFITPEQYQPDCTIYQGIALLCQSSDLTKAASACPNDYVMVLGEQPASIRSSAFKGVMSLNTNHPITVFAHEFGHVMANFAEEYLSEGASIPRGSENCQKKCSDFNKFLGKFGCSQECTNSNYYREFENGFMRSLNADRYGSYDELLMQDAINNQYHGSSITGKVTSTTSSCQNQQYYLVEQDDEEKFTVTLNKGCPNGGKNYGDFTYEIKDSSGNILSENLLPSNTLFTTDSNSDGKITSPKIQTNLPISFTIPATQTNKEDSLTIFNENKEVIYQTSLVGIGARPCKN
jgi:hypothetical protein